MTGKLKQKGLVQVRVYLNQAEFKAMAAEAEKSGFRRVGLQLQTQKPHGLDNEKQDNTDGCGPFLKHTFAYWTDHQAERLAKQAEALRVLEEAKKAAQAVGVRA